MRRFSDREVIARTADFVRKRLEKESSGHDWWHVYRVWQLARKIADEEDAWTIVVELAALLHDIADWKFNKGSSKIAVATTKDWLQSLKVSPKVIAAVCDIVEHVSFKGPSVRDTMKSLEGKIVQDADRLDAMGAMGVARTFAYGGKFGRPLYDPAISPKIRASAEQYKKLSIGKAPATSINHFYEKLLLLKARMNTRTAKRMAIERHAFMQIYLKRFFQEWEGKA